MPKIIWEGNKDWDTFFPGPPLGEGAREIAYPENIFTASIKYAVIPALVCAAALIAKGFIYGEMPLSRPFAAIGILLGLLLMPVHELLHAVCCPKNSEAHIGICLKKAAAFCVCHYPMSRRRFVVMSLAPVLLGLVPLVLFIVFPISWKIPSAVCWPAAIMGLISSSPDYMGVCAVLRQTPFGAKIQTSNDGVFCILPEADG